MENKKTYEFAVATHIKAEADFEKGTSSVSECNNQFFVDALTEKEWRNEDGSINIKGMRAITEGLISGLVTNIHYAHQMNMIDSADHLRLIISKLEKGFVAIGKAQKGEF